MKRSMPRSISVAGGSWLLVANLLLVLPAAAQPVLKGDDLTEKNLIEALSPAATPPAGAEGEEIKLRSIRVTRDQPSAKVVEQAARAPQAKPSASVLITFVTNSAELTPRARTALDVVGHALQSNQLASYRFIIEGHADPRGNPQSNLLLSQARAEAVVDYLVAQHGLTRERLNAVGKGDTELFNTQRIDAPENRRVTIVTVRE
jgi:outer membrane protein OmpA-like peptidoglycan-associated protein